MQPVSQFHDDDANIITHGHQHFAEILSLCFRAGREFDLGQLADAVYQFRNAFAEFPCDFSFGRVGIFDHVM